MKTTPDRSALRRAKAMLLKRYQAESWFRGVGIVPGPRKGLHLRLSVAPTARAKLLALPKMFRGYRLRVVFMDVYRPR